MLFRYEPEWILEFFQIALPKKAAAVLLVFGHHQPILVEYNSPTIYLIAEFLFLDFLQSLKVTRSKVSRVYQNRV